MSENWKWWIGSNDEHYNQTDATSRDEAIEAGIDEYGGDPFYIVEAEQGRVNWHFMRAGFIFDAIEDYHEELRGEDPLVECTAEQERDLEKCVGDAIAAWAERHGISSTTWAFARQRTAERIVPPTDEPPPP